MHEISSNYSVFRLIKYTGHVMKITHALQQKVIGKYKDILEHQLSIIEAQQQQIEKLQRELDAFKQQNHLTEERTTWQTLRLKVFKSQDVVVNPQKS